ncbi:MAG: hypothetical protein GDA46_03160 [Bdellovibrionales bacterium]|nr:hypothetical protein [Bdellovibrionales bacterium]
MKIALMYYFIVLSKASFSDKRIESQQLESVKVSKKQTDMKKQSDVYSFRPLLIQGGKKIKNSNHVKVNINSLGESEVFFVDIDFKKRIFLDEGVR